MFIILKEQWGARIREKRERKPIYSTFHSSKESIKVRAFIIEFWGNALLFDTFPIKKLMKVF